MILARATNFVRKIANARHGTGLTASVVSTMEKSLVAKAEDILHLKIETFPSYADNTAMLAPLPFLFFYSVSFSFFYVSKM
eukprot:g7996.t1